MATDHDTGSPARRYVELERKRLRTLVVKVPELIQALRKLWDMDNGTARIALMAVVAHVSQDLFSTKEDQNEFFCQVTGVNNA